MKASFIREPPLLKSNAIFFTRAPPCESGLAVDIGGFRSRQRGQVRRTLEGYHAFFPEPLPRSIDLDRGTVLALDEATAAIHRLGGVGRLLTNPALLMAPHVRLEAVLSSRIEGTEATVSDLLRYEVGDPERSHDSKDVLEVANYVGALDHGVSRLRADFPLSLRLLREIHERLLQGVRGHAQTPGEFRRSQNWIGPPGCTLDQATFVPPPVDHMHRALGDLERFLHEDGLPLLIRLAMAHYQFEAIHPFLDGNGRVGRLLMPLMLLDRRVLAEPLLYLSVYFERFRSRYYDLLLWTSQNGDFQPWFAFFLQAVASQAADAEERTVRLVDEQARLRNRLLEEKATVTVVRLGDFLFARPFVTASLLTSALDVTTPTAQAAINELVSRGVLEEVTGRRRGRVYFAPAIFDAVYGQLEQGDVRRH